MYLYVVGLVFAASIWWLYSRSKAQIPRIYGKPSKIKTALAKHSNVLKTHYYPPFWSFCGSFHSIIRHLVKTKLILPFERELFKLNDGGQVALDWLHPSNGNYGAKSPVILVLPGLTGSSSDSYVVHLVKLSSSEGYRTVVFNNRGNGGVALLTPKVYSAAYTDDLREVVGHIRRQYPDADILGVGFSLGGMILANYVSKYDATECGLKAAMIISSPWNTADSTKSLEKPINRLFFNYGLARNLCRNIEKDRSMFEGTVDVDHILRSQLIREFDERCIVPMFNYKDVWDYYHDASLHYKVNSVSVPTLCLNAADDCFAPICSIPLESVQQSDNVLVVVTSHGGHLGFMKADSPTNGGLMEDLFSDYAKVVFEVI